MLKTDSSGLESLRDYADVLADDVDAPNLRDIADRIEYEMMMLPVGGDGVPIRPNETVWTEHGDAFVVTAVPQIQSPGIRGHYEDKICTLVFPASTLTHIQPDSIERIHSDAEAHMTGEHCDDDWCLDLIDRAYALRKEAGDEG